MYILISRCPLHDRTILARQYCRRHCKSTCTRDKLITKQHVRKCNYFLNFQNEQYVFNILFSKKKAPLCWDLQTSNWCFNVKENILQIIIIVQLDLLFILKKVLHKMEIRLSPAGSSNYIFELSKNCFNGKLTWIIFRCKIERVHFQQ